jgi:murein L,D-transpeptidase YcbB/YkuD
MNGLLQMSGLRSIMLASAAIFLPTAPLLAQARPAAPVARPVAAPAKPAAAQPGVTVPGNPAPQPQAAQPVVAPVPPPLPPAIWDALNAQDLLYYIQQIGREGLNPADYDPAGLIAAMRQPDPLVLSKEATDRFNMVSSDLALGHVKKSARGPWFVTDPDLDAAQQNDLLRRALAAHRIAAALNGLLPTHPQYAALKSALEITPATDTAKIDRIRLNMDRWRWLPRDLGP